MKIIEIEEEKYTHSSHDFLFIDFGSHDDFVAAKESIESYFEIRIFNKKLKLHIKYSEEELKIYIDLPFEDFIGNIQRHAKNLFQNFSFPYINKNDCDAEVEIQSIESYKKIAAYLPFDEQIRRKISQFEFNDLEEKSDTFNKIQKIVANYTEYRNRTYCFETANFITTLLAGKSITSQENKVENMNFFDKNQDGNYKNTVIQKLFEPSSSAEHLVFQIKLPEDIHAFVIEKQSNGEETSWVIYQSWMRKYNLGQWIGVDSWPENEDKGIYNRYGGGKKLNEEQIKSFISETLDDCTNDGEIHTNNRKVTDISMYPVTYNLIDLACNFKKPKKESEVTVTQFYVSSNNSNNSSLIMRFGNPVLSNSLKEEDENSESLKSSLESETRFGMNS